MKIRGVGRTLLYLARKRSESIKKSFIIQHKDLIKKNLAVSPGKFEGILLGYSGKNYFYEQLYSSLSFIKNIGLPDKWIIVSDGTYTAQQKNTLELIPNLQVVNYDVLIDKDFKTLDPLKEAHRMGQFGTTYFSILNKVNGRLIYMEADVLVFGLFNRYAHLFNTHNWYLTDTAPHFDSSYYKENQIPMFPLNNGFAIYNKRPPLEVACKYMIDRLNDGGFEYFTPQSASQLMVDKDTYSKIFDPRYFVVSGSDHFKYTIDHLPENIALRHYVGPVRHKMWQTDWREVLQVL